MALLILGKAIFTINSHLKQIVLFILLFIGLSQRVVYAQQYDIDALNHELHSNAADTNQVITLNELAWQLRKSNSQQAKQYAIKAQQLSKKLSYSSGHLTSLIRLGTVETYLKNYKDAESIFLEILVIEKGNNNVYGIGRAQNQLCNIYRSQGNYSDAVNFGLKALHNFESIQKEQIVATVANNLGAAYKNLGDLKNALKYYQKSLEIRERLNLQGQIGQNYLNLGSFYVTAGNLIKGLEYLVLAEKKFQTQNNNYDLAKVYGNIGNVYYQKSDLTKALEYYNRSLELKKALDVIEKDPLIFNNIGAIYYKQNDFDNALKYYLKSCSIQEENDEDILFMDSYTNVGDIYLYRKDFSNAIYYYLRSLDIARSSDKKIIEAQTMKRLSECYSYIGEFEIADDYNKKYIQLTDSLDNNFRDAMILAQQFQDEKFKTELLQKDLKIKNERIKNYEAKNEIQLVTIVSLIVSVSLILILFTTILRVRAQRQKRIKAEKEAEVQAQKLEELIRSGELKSLNAMLLGQEEERKRIAKDLHDSVGSMLSVVQMHFGMVENQIEGLRKPSNKQYKKAYTLLNDAIQEVRNVSHNLENGTLNKFGITAAVEDLCESISSSQIIKAECISHALEDRLGFELEVVIYRVIQELVKNVLYHSKADELTVQLIRSKNFINITVEDNGVGFDHTEATNGMGFNNIEARIEPFGGIISVDSQKEAGTIITVDIPIKN